MTAGTVATRPLRARAVAGEQLLVAGGQIAAGAGNLAFALVAARLLAPGAFADLAAFLALYLLLHVPAASLSAGSALTPALAARLRRRVLLGGIAAGAVLLATAEPLAAALRVPEALVLTLAAAAPGAGLIALERGRLHGSRRRVRAVASLLAEPAVRLTLGVAAATSLGALGGALAAVVAGYAALAVAGLDRGAKVPGPEAARVLRPGTTIAAFLLLAVIQTQDVVLAGAMLPADEAGRFAVLSTLGGIAVFATTTVPLVLLSRSAAGERSALPAALLVAAALGGGAFAGVAVAPADLIGSLFGARYSEAGALAAPYVLAMALLGVARVLVAHACARGGGRPTVVVLVGAAALHAALIVVLGDDAAGIAQATLIATAALTAASGGVAVLRLPAIQRPRSRRLRLRPQRPGALLMVGAATLGGLGLRLVAERGIWLDEAISIRQAEMPFGDMLTTLRDTDVHPPLHHAALWLAVRLLGTDPLAVRTPSLIAGTLLIPMLYIAGHDLYDRRAGVAAALLGAVAPFAIWYSDEARMYAFFMLFALVAVWAQARVLTDGRARHWAIYVLATAALVWSQYFALLFVAVQQAGFVVAMVARRRSGRRVAPLVWGWLGSAVAIAALLAPLAPFAAHQFSVNEAAGRGFEAVPSQAGQDVDTEGDTPSLYGAITNAVWAMWGYHTNELMARLVALWPLLMLAALLLLGRGRSRTTLLLAAAAVLPAAALFVIGQAKPFVFEVRYFIGAVPIALLLAARALTGWTQSALGRTLAVTAMAITLIAGVADQQLNGTNPRLYDFDGALSLIADRARPGDVVLYQPAYVKDVVSYYGGDRLKARPLGTRLPAPGDGRRVFLLGSFLEEPDVAGETGQALAELGRERHLAATYERPQVRVWEFR